MSRPVANSRSRQYHLRTMRRELEPGAGEVQEAAAAPAPRRPARREGRPWPVKALTLLLVVQGVGLLVVGVFSVNRSASLWEILTEDSFYATLPPLGVLALVTAIGFLGLRPWAWVTAMLVQGLTLLVALIFYFRYRPQDVLIYGMMVYAITMVLYLNYAEVPAVFQARRGEERAG